MIIKRKNKSQSSADNTSIDSVTKNAKNESIEKSPLDSAFGDIKERQERRRGDRRRGYRRVDDRNLISRAQEEANAIKERAAKEGFSSGIASSQNEIVNLNNAIDELLRAKELSMQKFLDDIVFLSVKVAEKIIKTEVACDETIVLNIVSEVIKEIGKNESRIIIRTNPADSDLVRNNLPKIFPYGSSNAKIAVMDDNDIDWGSCIVETNNGIVDAKFSTQFDVLNKAFKEKL
jgi:flagellar biosynthesis/type III secretory pathway protein FliH